MAINPDLPMCAPAQQIRFRHTLLPMPKLAQLLNHATSGTQVSFIITERRFCKTSGIPDSANTGFIRKAAQPTLEKFFKDISRSETMPSDHGWSIKRNGVLLFQAACQFLLFFFLYSYSQQIKEVRGGFEDTNKRRTDIPN